MIVFSNRRVKKIWERKKKNHFHFLGVLSSDGGHVCSTWGYYHFKTFDGDFFQLPSSCNYVLTSLCKSDYEEFYIQLQRGEVNDHPIINKVTIKLEGTLVELSNNSVSVDEKRCV